MKPAVAVFGSSEPLPGDALYRSARSLGTALAAAGFDVVTGGYGGVMEAASRGAREGGGDAIGVTCEIFRSREPNGYLSLAVPTPDLFLRTRELVRRACGFVVLDGKAGTLAELAFLWALARAGCLGDCPVLLLGDVYPELLAFLEKIGMLEPRQIEATRVVATADEAVEYLLRAGPAA